MLHVVRNHPDYLNSQEELELISPLLTSLKKEPVFSVPNNYFENFTVALNHRPAESTGQSAKVVGMFSRKFMRYAAAAIITAVVATTGWLIYKNGQKPADEKIMAKVEKDVKKIKDVTQLNKLADFIDAGANEKDIAGSSKIQNDVEKLLKDVSLDELKEFNEESNDIQDVMMTN
jgi:hypothetical protein